MNDPTPSSSRTPRNAGASLDDTDSGLLGRLRRLFGASENTDGGDWRSTITGSNGSNSIYGELSNGPNGLNGISHDTDTAAADHERMLIQNVLALRDLSVVDCMVPRVDINGVEINTSRSDLLMLLANKTHSRMPVYRESLDEIVGILHIRDVLAAMAAGKELVLTDLVRDAMIVAPSMPVLDLLLEMRLKQTHMALVVDEFGGIDGLVTIEDLVEQIVGEIRDEHETNDEPRLIERPDGTLVADARMDIDDFEQHVGPVLTEEEREDIDTLGGLVFAIAGEVPNRGALLTHSSGLEFEVLECDPRRIRKLRVRNLQALTQQPPQDQRKRSANG
jgi:CBS domain containing-hemolysin-like protein